VGGQRFRVLRTVSDEPYLVGEVETLTCNGDGAPAGDLADTAAALLGEYYRLFLALSGQWARALGKPGEPGPLADFIASRLAVSLSTKQRLLEELSARRRLEMEVEIISDAIREMTPRVRAARGSRWRGFGVTN